MKHDKMHWRCCWKPMLGLLLWVAAAFSVVMAWLSRGAPLLGYNDVGWYMNAVVLALLAIPMKLGGGWCGKHGDTCGGGMCGTPDKM